MHTPSNNERLRALVEASGLSHAAAREVFNRGLGARGYSYSHWRAFFVDPASPRFRALRDDMLQHAEKNFGKPKAIA